MSSYSELIKNFEKIRAYMRDFYVYGFKSRDDYQNRSARSYDDERRRLESWLGDHMSFVRTSEGKNVFISIDSRTIKHNPLYNAWKAKSFTDGDITLHFIIFDILYEPSVKKTVSELLKGIDEKYLSGFDKPMAFDESTVRKKLKEYCEAGIIMAEKEGRKMYYRRTESLDISNLNDVLHFFSEVAPCGVIGSFILDKEKADADAFTFKHHYIIGQFNTAKCFATTLENGAYEQIKAVCDTEAFSSSKIRIMPDVHAGKGCTIGTTMTITDKIVPSMVGVDIGCGMYTVYLGNIDIDFKKVDEVAHSIPCGRNVWEGRQEKFDLTQLRCYRNLKDSKRLERSLGTLGGGNHFIEINVDENDGKYLVIHSGSRNLGTQVAEYYQQIAVDLNTGKEEYFKQREEIIRTYKEQGRRTEIQATIKALEKEFNAKEPTLPRDLCFLYGSFMEDYLHDVDICQKFAERNRAKMAEIILERCGWTAFNTFQTIHNYIDVNEMILRKGAVSAKAGEKLLIPINMRDGSLICIGKGNDDWNCSAPHGAGRLMSRSDAFERLTMDEYKTEMAGVYSTCVVPDTLDESPMAYKSMDEIVKNIKPTTEIVCRIKPIYNFKVSE